MSLVRSLTLTLSYPTCPFPGYFYHYIPLIDFATENAPSTYSRLQVNTDMAEME